MTAKLQQYCRSPRILLFLLIALALAGTSCQSAKKRRSKAKAHASARPVPASLPRPAQSPLPKAEPAHPSPSEVESEAPPAPVPAPAEIPKREVQVSQVLALARDYLGTRHKIGGQSKAGIDCSGLAQLSYSMVGVELPRSTTDQQYAGTPVKREEIQLGDLLFFTYPGGSRISHVGIVYEINGENDVVFIHASTSRGVRVDNLYSEYWSKLFRRARRVLD